jgi:hypothetical protein
MKTYVHLWKYPAEFFLEQEMLQTEVIKKIKKIYFKFNNFVLRKSCLLWDNVEKYGRVRQATDDNIIRRMRFACWITKATDTHSEYKILIVFLLQQWLCDRASMLRSYVHCLYFSQMPEKCNKFEFHKSVSGSVHWGSWASLNALWTHAHFIY